MKTRFVTGWRLVCLGLLASQPACTLADDDKEAPTTAAPTEFRMTVADHFGIASGGTVVTGVIESGTVSVDDSICILSEKAGAKPLKVTGIESFNKLLETAAANDRVGLLVTGIALDAISVGDRLVGSCDVPGMDVS